MDFLIRFAYGFKLLIALNTPATFLELSYTGTIYVITNSFVITLRFRINALCLPKKAESTLLLYTFDKSLYSTCVDEFVKCISRCESIYKTEVKAFSFFISANEESISVLFDRLFAQVFNKTKSVCFCEEIRCLHKSIS